jgi:hypothetical protein
MNTGLVNDACDVRITSGPLPATTRAAFMADLLHVTRHAAA